MKRNRDLMTLCGMISKLQEYEEAGRDTAHLEMVIARFIEMI